MNSKQALDHIKHMADWEYYDIKGDILPIEKDLEVLEILKRHSTMLDDEDWENNIFNGIDYEYLNEEERKVIKEWLENDI